MKTNYNHMIRSNILASMSIAAGRHTDRVHKRKKEKAGIELQTFANRALASNAQNYTHKLFMKDKEVLQLQKQIKKKNKIIGTLSILLVATSITAVLFWVWAIYLRDSIIWHNYTEHNNNNIERVVIDEVE